MSIHSSTAFEHRLPAPASRAAVHPGWLHPERIALQDEQEQPDLADATRFATVSQLLRTAGALDRAAADLLSDLGLTAGAFFALLELRETEPVGLAPSALARRLAVARRTATLYVDILTRKGWVTRSAHPEDRRMVLARLTDEGMALVEETGPIYKQRLAALIDTVSPLQAERLRQLLVQVPVGIRSSDDAIDCADG